ncbi:magnesium transporter MgtE N-terminal domain-containing protein, partial [Burkholderia cenocepacia]|uniref:magnesium transporter MgtE N-terminal domain-containing protein n=1 Tax=Burkholderia cenocepacia TaxID=95486 RepID=UPI0038CC10F9
MPLDLDLVRDRIRSRELLPLARDVRAAPTDDVVATLDALPTADAAVVFRLLGKSTAAEVLDRLDARAQSDLVLRLDDDVVVDAFAHLDPDEQARLLDELPASAARRLVAAVGADRLEATMALMGYPAGAVARRMQPTTVRLLADRSVGEALDELRTAQDVGPVVPVLTGQRILVGVVDLATLLRAPASAA